MDGFDRTMWELKLKQLKKDFLIEDRDRFRPLLRLKREPAIKEFMDDIEKLEKKYEVALMRERDQIKQ